MNSVNRILSFAAGAVFVLGVAGSANALGIGASIGGVGLALDVAGPGIPAESVNSPAGTAGLPGAISGSPLNGSMARAGLGLPSAPTGAPALPAASASKSPSLKKLPKKVGGHKLP